jgi:hypothetical protein
LEVHQDDVGLRFVAQLDESLADGPGGFVEGGRWRILVRALPDRIRSDLPDHQIWVLVDDVGTEPPKFGGRFLAPYSLVDHDDPSVLIFGPKETRQPLRVGPDVAFARGRRRADRDDFGLPSGETLRKLGQAVLEGDWQNRDL